MITRWLRRAFPYCDYYLSLGAAVHQIMRLSLRREDLQFVIYRGQLRAGYADEHHDDLEVRVGTLYVEPTTDEWVLLAELTAEIKRKVAV